MFVGSIALITYIALSFGTLGILGWMILRIGALLGDCPASNARAKAASVTIATGYLAIGAGGVVLGGAAAVFVAPNVAGIVAILGAIVLCLGLGFSNAIATLRAVIAPAPSANPEPEQVPLEPVLS